MCVRLRIPYEYGEKWSTTASEIYCGYIPLVRTVGLFDQHTYLVIIYYHILPFMYNVHSGPATFVLQEDNCGPHRARSIATYLQNEEIERMIWPAQSPDLNPI